MHRLIRFASVAMVSGLLGAGLAQAETPLLNEACLEDMAACGGAQSGLEPGEVRVRPISAIKASDDGPLLLTNRDLGLSDDELAHKAAEAEPVELARVEDAAEETAPEAPAEAPVEEAAAEPTPGEAVEAPADEEIAAPLPVVATSEFSTDESGVAQIDDSLDFDGCMELSIRGGNAFDESRRVCAVVFPE
ncbi:MAG: hypothetical protein ACQGVK_00565 [Myxococcota bacterium]